MTSTGVSAAQDDEVKTTRATPSLDVSVTVAGSSEPAVTCTEGDTIALCISATPKDPDQTVSLLYSFGWRWSWEGQQDPPVYYHMIQYQGTSSSVQMTLPAKPSDGSYIELYFGVRVDHSGGTGAYRDYRSLYISKGSDTSAIYGALTSDPSYPDYSDASAESFADSYTSYVTSYVAGIAIPSLPDATGIFDLGLSLFPDCIKVLLPLVVILVFVVYLLRR